MDEPPQMHDGEVVEIYTLADAAGMIRNHGFINCEIVGPAVLGTSQSVFRFNKTTNNVDFAVIDLKRTQIGVSGTLTVHRCSFEYCLFHNVGFATHPDQYERFKWTLEQA